MDTFTQLVLAEKNEAAVATLNKLKNRINKRHGVEAFSFVVKYEDKFIKKITTTSGYTKKRLVIPIEVSLVMPSVEYEDYTYIATLKIGSKSNDVYPADGWGDYDFSNYFESNFKCDHCNTNRVRKQVHIFKKHTGEEITIANTCSQDYFGIDVASKIKNIIWNRSTIDNRYYSDMFDGFMGNDGIDEKEFVTLAQGLIIHNGCYESKSKTENSTSDQAEYYLTESIDSRNRLPSATQAEYDEDCATQKSILALANKNGFDYDKFIDYWENIDFKNSTFINNCRNAVFSDTANTGLRAYAVWHITNEERKAMLEQEKKILNEHIGAESDKIAVKMTVERFKRIQTNYGESIVVSGADKDGRAVVFFDSKCNEYGIGQQLNINCKVKSHSLYNGRKQTTVNYVKFMGV